MFYSDGLNQELPVQAINLKSPNAVPNDIKDILSGYEVVSVYSIPKQPYGL
jgi:hypothetical protein